jgi:Icc protein
MRLLHLTDTHLSHLPSYFSVEMFGQKVREHFAPDHVTITGDVATLGGLHRCLVQLREGLKTPISFVLGNHDSHGATWAEAREHARRLGRTLPWLTYLDGATSVPLTKGSVLVGCDGWYDARLGSRFEEERAKNVSADLYRVSNTHRLISSGKKGIATAAKMCREYADSLVEESRGTIRRALKGHRKVFFATHIPPFAESAWHQSAPSSEDWLPLMTCKAMGDMLLKEASANQASEIVVLCGHTHTARRYQAAANLTVYTGHSGASDYGDPGVSNFFDLEDM